AWASTRPDEEERPGTRTSTRSAAARESRWCIATLYQVSVDRRRGLPGRFRIVCFGVTGHGSKRCAACAHRESTGLGGRACRLRQGAGGIAARAARASAGGSAVLAVAAHRAPAPDAARHSRFLPQPEVRRARLAQRLLAADRRAALARRLGRQPRRVPPRA